MSYIVVEILFFCDIILLVISAEEVMIRYIIIGTIVLVGIILFVAILRSKSFGRGRKLYNKTVEEIGIEGEIEVALELKRFKERQYVFNDYKTLNGERSCQIDHIVVNNCGVFVLETKNYKGIISGMRNQRYWMQTLLFGEEKKQFYNPIKQNNTHKGVVQHIVGKNVPVYAYVVFVNNNLEYINEPDVIRLDQLHDSIYLHDTKLSDEEVKSIIQKLQAQKHYFTDEEHVANIKEAEWKVEHNICPRCSGKLVLRHGKYGDFYGCENYPQCKFKKKLDD